MVHYLQPHWIIIFGFKVEETLRRATEYGKSKSPRCSGPIGAPNNHLCESPGLPVTLKCTMRILARKESRDVAAYVEDWSGAQHHGYDNQLDVANVTGPGGTQHHQALGGATGDTG